MDCRSRQNYPSRQTRAPSVRFHPLESGVFYRRPQGATLTKKRQSPVRLPGRLLAHLRRWNRLGIARHAVVEWNGKPIVSVRKSFGAAVTAAGIGRHATPHILRHTAATWGMQRGADLWQLAGWLGMSPEILERVYGHHHPDFQRDTAEKVAGQNRDRNAVNKRRETPSNEAKNTDNAREMR
jgi:integrase